MRTESGGLPAGVAGGARTAKKSLDHPARYWSVGWLEGAARRSPVHALISPLTHVAVPLGILIAVGELAVGVGTLLGLRARLAAAGGLVLSLMLFLTVSFHSAPYYTGADIVFAFAWTPLLLAGSGSVLSLDAAITDWAGQKAAAARRQAQRSGPAGQGGPPPRSGAPRYGDCRGRGPKPRHRWTDRGSGQAGRRDRGQSRHVEPVLGRRSRPDRG
jgi:uncharacterized membrane protein YphA (DoxX/SURF4 family)